METDDTRVRAAQQMLESGNREEALDLLRAILGRNPRHAAANNLVGFIALQKGQPDEAEPWFRIAAEAEPDNSVYRDNIGIARAIKLQWTDTGPLRAALVANPRQPEIWRKLAQAEAAARRIDATIAALYEGLSHCPEHPELLHALGNYLHYAGRLAEAATHYHHCIRVAPQLVDARIDLSLIYLRLLDAELAESAARGAVECAPQSARAAVNLATVLYQRNRFTEALTHLERGRELAPQEARTYNQLGMTYSALGDIDRAIANYRHAARLNPDYHLTRSNLMLTLLYSDKASGDEIYREACAYGKQFLPAGKVTHTNSRDPERQLRIGFVSGDFRRHVVGMFLLPLFANRDRARAEYFCYSLIDAPDPFTQMLASHADHWTDIRAMDDAQLAARVRADAIDILVDLTGHTSDNRLQAFARRPAPVQVTWLGYPGTTGAPGIDYRFTDEVLDPPGSENQSTEKPVRLRSGYFCYQPTPEWGGLLKVGVLPAARNAHVTFGAFNNLAKITPVCLNTWAEILRNTPGSQLISRAKPFSIPEERERFVRHFTQRGIEASRIKPLAYLPDPARHLEVYNDIDIHLDSMPYTGGTTTCDALWMGVPVITLRGDRPSARLGASVLERVGLQEMIAYDAIHYAQLAVNLANDKPRLAALRGGMRARFVGSPLHDGRLFAQEFDGACRAIWREWCARQTSD
jgi:protein O-GlcNAc transferase